MGFDHDFTTGFYAYPGIRLNFFDSLESLDYSNSSEKYTNNNLNFDKLKIGELICIDEFDEIEDLLGYHEIVELHKFQGMLAIHDVLLKLDSKKTF